jgi:hypothetical protein
VTSDQQADFLAHLRAGMRRGAAAEFLGLSRFTTYAFIAEHPDFERQVLESEDAALENVEEALYQAAVTGNVRACELWLNLHPRSRSSALPAPPGAISTPADADANLERMLENLGG